MASADVPTNTTNFKSKFVILEEKRSLSPLDALLKYIYISYPIVADLRGVKKFWTPLQTPK